MVTINENVSKAVGVTSSAETAPSSAPSETPAAIVLNSPGALAKVETGFERVKASQRFEKVASVAVRVAKARELAEQTAIDSIDAELGYREGLGLPFEICGFVALDNATWVAACDASEQPHEKDYVMRGSFRQAVASMLKSRLKERFEGTDIELVDTYTSSYDGAAYASIQVSLKTRPEPKVTTALATVPDEPAAEPKKRRWYLLWLA